MRNLKVGDTVLYRLDKKEYTITRVSRAVMVGPIFYFTFTDGQQKSDAKKNYHWNELQQKWLPKEDK